MTSQQDSSISTVNLYYEDDDVLVPTTEFFQRLAQEIQDDAVGHDDAKVRLSAGDKAKLDAGTLTFSDYFKTACQRECNAMLRGIRRSQPLKIKKTKTKKSNKRCMSWCGRNGIAAPCKRWCITEDDDFCKLHSTELTIEDKHISSHSSFTFKQKTDGIDIVYNVGTYIAHKRGKFTEFDDEHPEKYIITHKWQCWGRQDKNWETTNLQGDKLIISNKPYWATNKDELQTEYFNYKTDASYTTVSAVIFLQCVAKKYLKRQNEEYEATKDEFDI